MHVKENTLHLLYSMTSCSPPCPILDATPHHSLYSTFMVSVLVVLYMCMYYAFIYISLCIYLYFFIHLFIFKSVFCVQQKECSICLYESGIVVLTFLQDAY